MAPATAGKADVDASSSPVELRSLRDEITEAEDMARETRKEDRNSYGAGYDSGFAAGLRRALELMTGESE